MRQTMTPEQFKKAGAEILTGYKVKEAEQAETLAADVRPYWECKVVYSYSEQDGKIIFENPHVKLHHETLEIFISFSTYTKRYNITCTSLYDLYHTSSSKSKTLTEPQNIGKLSHKKLADWIKYFEDLYNEKAIEHKANREKFAAFRKQLEAHEVHWYDEKKEKGWIQKNGIRYSFTFEKTYINELMEINGVDSTLDNFIDLSNNRYRPRK